MTANAQVHDEPVSWLARQAYTAPKLICHGEIHAVTRTSPTINGLPTDGGSSPNWYPS